MESQEPSPKQIQQAFEQAVTLSLHTWPALILAVQNNWGGPDSNDKRAWFAGAIVDLFPNLATKPTALQSLRNSKPNEEEPDVDMIEEVLLQVMMDEFEVDVDDDSEAEVAAQIIHLRKQCAKGNFDELQALASKYQSTKGSSVVFAKGKKGHGTDESENESEDDDDDDDDGDGCDDNNDNSDEQEMQDVLTATKHKPEPEVDEDGFIKVTRKKR